MFQKVAWFNYCAVVLLAWLQPCWAVSSSSSPAPLGMAELASLMISLKGDDTRLFRWDVTEHTAERQQEGDCEKLVQAAQWLITDAADQKRTTLELVWAMDYLTLCITNHPLNRATFSNVPHIHEVVIALVSSADKQVSALACHLIYIATYTNEKNHQAFYTHGAVPALAKLLMKKQSNALQKMWAASALQNLAASYCKTPDDEVVGTCHWDWTTTNEHIQLSVEDSPLYSDATPVRKQILSTEEEGLVDTLIELACQRPVVLDEEDFAVMAGSTALAGEDDNFEEIVTWAAMGTLKNLALEPTAKHLLERALECACFLKESPDWLDQSKSNDFIYFMRRVADPCWMEFDGSGVCVDDNFFDQDMHHCEDYSDATEAECQSAVDVFTGKTAAEMCCRCSGGSLYKMEETPHDDL